MRSIVFLLLLCVAVTANAREAGWVPLPAEPWQPPAAAGLQAKPEKTGKRIPVSPVVGGAAVYEGQPPVTDQEVVRFLAILPAFRAWARQTHEEAHPVVNKQGKPDFLYSARAAKWIEEHSFSPMRFFCIMGRMAACLVIIEEGNDLKATRPKDMPDVVSAEIAVARRHLGELLTVGNSPVPIN